MDGCQHLVWMNGILPTTAELLLQAVRLHRTTLHRSYFKRFCAFCLFPPFLSLSLSPSLHGPGNTNVVKENFNSAEIIWTEKKYHCSGIPRADFFVMLARKLPYFPVWRRALAGENQVWQKGEVKVLTNPAAPAGCPHSHGPLG